MHIIIDFDYTLFDTETFRQGLIERLAPWGISDEDFRSTEQEAKGETGYHIQDHLALLLPDAEDRAEAIPVIDSFMEALDRYLYPDASQFLLKYGHDMVTVLSAGHQEWQELKVQNAGMGAVADDVIIVPGNKEEVMQQWQGDAGVIVINDRGDEIDAMYTAAPEAVYLHLAREGTPYEETHCAYATATITDLSVDLSYYLAD